MSKNNQNKINDNFSTEELITYLSDLLTQRKKKIQNTLIVSLIGGAASGKGTITRLLVEDLKRRSVSSDVISTDDYVIGDRAFRRANFEGKDTLAKYDFSLLNEKIELIKINKNPAVAISVPTYDEFTGVAVVLGEENYTHKILPVDILIIEGDFDAVKNPDLMLYLNLTDEQRLKNRVNRDAKTRNEVPAKIIENFELRQKTQHIPYTIKAMGKADYVINGRVRDGGEFVYDVRDGVSS